MKREGANKRTTQKKRTHALKMAIDANNQTGLELDCDNFCLFFFFRIFVH